jgi:hypothetical protein
VDRHKVELVRIRSSRLVAMQTARWSALSAVAGTPLRQPIASAGVVEPGAWVGLTDRRDAVLLDSQLRVVERIDDRIPWVNVGCWQRHPTGLAGPKPCSAGGAPPALGSAGDVVDTMASARIVDDAGQPRLLAAWRNAETGTLHVLDDRGGRVEVPHAGAQLTLGDLDRDGQPEIIASADTLDPAGDAVIVRTWQTDGRLVERYRIKVPTGVRALAVCPPEDARVGAIAVGAGDGVWIVR